MQAPTQKNEYRPERERKGGGGGKREREREIFSFIIYLDAPTQKNE